MHPLGHRKFGSQKYDDDLLAYLLPSPRLGLDESRDALTFLPKPDDIVERGPLTTVPDTNGTLGIVTKRRTSLANGNSEVIKLDRASHCKLSVWFSL